LLTLIIAITAFPNTYNNTNSRGLQSSVWTSLTNNLYDPSRPSIRISNPSATPAKNKQQQSNPPVSPFSASSTMAEFVRAQIFGTTFEITSRYSDLQPVGMGAFGLVWLVLPLVPLLQRCPRR
jgi:hypothetical protein